MENYNFDIQEELKKLPAKPGVYIMHDERDHIIYVGKAISLKNRVRQYFQTSRNKGVKIEQMVTHIRRFEYIVTDSELEALVLECNLIKEHHPKYNTMLMDDKTYPFIKVTVNEDFPRVMLARKMLKDKAKYFGPYTSGQAVRDTIDLLHKLYHVRSCNRNLPKDIGKERPCLNYHIKQCDAPCQGYISKEEYGKAISEVIRFLNGNFDGILKDLEEKMQKASEELKFEKAIEYRELLGSVKKIAQKQKITDSSGEDRDILAAAIQEEDAVVQVFFIRGGRLIGRDHFYLRISKGETCGEILDSFIKQYYAGTPFIPGELMLQEEIEDASLLEEWLSVKRGGKVNIRVPKKGTKEKLVELAANNAENQGEDPAERVYMEIMQRDPVDKGQRRIRARRQRHDLQLSGEITNYDALNKGIGSDGYSSMVELRMTVRVNFVNNSNPTENMNGQQFSASREYNANQQLSAVQDELVTQMIKEIVEQIFNATVANW